MTGFCDLTLRVRGLFAKAKEDQRLDEELRFHLEQQIEANIAQGMTPEEARYSALKTFGGIEQVKDECRDMRGIQFVETLIQDLRYGLRQLRRNPGFTAVAILTLALGVGANTAIFSVVNAVLLRPLPYRDPGRLVWAAEHFGFSHGPAAVVSPDFAAWRDQNRVFQQVGAFEGEGAANLTSTGQPQRVSVTQITASLFPMLGVQPLFGRWFLSEENKQDQNHVALLNEGLWRSRFGGDRNVLGRTVQLDGTPYTIVGVMPSSLRYPGSDVWTPMALDGKKFSPQSPNWDILAVIGRLKYGSTPAQAQSDLQLITRRMDREYPPQAARFRSHIGIEVIPLHAMLVQNVRSLLFILLGAVGFVLLIACANVANLLLSRNAVRGMEMAVRAALGAGRPRLMRQVYTESLLLAMMGGLLGVLAGLCGVRLLRQLIPSNLSAEVHLDHRILGFVLAISSFAVSLFGLLPALIASRPGLIEVLKEGGKRVMASRGTHRLRGVLVSAEIALSLVLLIGAGLLIRSFARLTNVALGFNPHHVLMASIWRPASMESSPQQNATFFRDVLGRVRSLPGVLQAGATTHYPLSAPNDTSVSLEVQGAGTVRPALPIFVTSVSPDYFRTLAIRLLKGRFFNEHDGTGAPRVVILSDTLAREAFRDGDPLGQRVRLGGPDTAWASVVGVVADARNYALSEQPWPEIFLPANERPEFFMTLVLRTQGHPQTLARTVVKAVQGVDKNQPVSGIDAMDEFVRRSEAPAQFKMLLLGLFALLAMLLAAVGIYGVISYSVIERTHEVGIRMALGAEKSAILRMVIGQGLRLALVGIIIGVAGAAGLTRFLASMLYGVRPTDTITFFLVVLLMLAVALLSCYIPARRAAKVDPIVALRHE